MRFGNWVWSVRGVGSLLCLCQGQQGLMLNGNTTRFRIGSGVFILWLASGLCNLNGVIKRWVKRYLNSVNFE